MSTHAGATSRRSGSLYLPASSCAGGNRRAAHPPTRAKGEPTMKTAGALLLAMLLGVTACTTGYNRTRPAGAKSKLCEPADGVSKTRGRPGVKCRE
jgi:hypothetical protein